MFVLAYFSLPLSKVLSGAALCHSPCLSFRSRIPFLRFVYGVDLVHFLFTVRKGCQRIVKRIVLIVLRFVVVTSNEIFYLVPRVTLIFFDRAACCLKARDYGRRVFKRKILGYMQTSWLCGRLFKVGTSSCSAGTFSCGERVFGVGKAKKNNKAVAWWSSLLYSEASFLGLDRVSDCAVWLSPAKVVRVCDFVLKTFF